MPSIAAHTDMKPHNVTDLRRSVVLLLKVYRTTGGAVKCSAERQRSPQDHVAKMHVYDRGDRTKVEVLFAASPLPASGRDCARTAM